MLPFDSITQNFFPLVRKDSVFGSSRGDDLWFWPFIRVKMVQHRHERSKVPTQCLVHLIQFWSGGKDYTKDGLCVLCAYLSETYTTNITRFNLNLQNDIDDINTCINSINNINVNERYSIFNQKLFAILDKYFPKVKLSRKKFNDKEWITDGIKRSIKQRNKLFHVQFNDSTQFNIDK